MSNIITYACKWYIVHYSHNINITQDIRRTWHCTMPKTCIVDVMGTYFRIALRVNRITYNCAWAAIGELPYWSAERSPPHPVAQNDLNVRCDRPFRWHSSQSLLSTSERFQPDQRAVIMICPALALYFHDNISIMCCNEAIIRSSPLPVRFVIPFTSAGHNEQDHRFPSRNLGYHAVSFRLH